MSDFLEEAAEWLDGVRHDSLVRSVTYNRGATSVAIFATKAQTMFRFVDEYGVTQRIESTDWLVRTADLTDAGITLDPQRGDQIDEVVGATTLTFEVLAPNDEPHWRWHDRARSTLRIHSKLVGEA
jgi:hypothetical protein